MKNLKSKIIAFIIGVLAGILLVTALYFIPSLKKEEEKTISSAEITERIKGISELASLSYEYTNVGKFENSIQVFGYDLPLTKKSFILTYSGKVKMGVDLSKVSVMINGKKIIIKLPAAEVLSNEIYQDSFEIYDESTSLFNSFKLEDYSTFEANEKVKVLDRIEKNGYLKEAKERAAECIRELLEDLLDEDYELVIQ